MVATSSNARMILSGRRRAKLKIAPSGEARLFLNRMRVARALHRSIETLERMKFVFHVAALIALSIEAIDSARTDFTTRALARHSI